MRFRMPGFAELDSFVGAGYAEPADASLLQSLRNRHGAKAVSIRLYDREDHGLRADVRPNHLEILQDRLERNLGPYGAPLEMYRLCHVLLEVPESASTARLKFEPRCSLAPFG